MTNDNIFITGIGAVSPQKTFDNALFLDELVNSEGAMLRCADPNYKEYISGDLVRRMSRIIKMGVAASKIAMNDARCGMPDAIITGTGLGCIEDTEKFLITLLQNNEEFLTPTSFIQSTHNTVSAQIALLMKCHNYNFTYVNRGISFESAVIDTMARMRLEQSPTVLLGGVDEMTKNTFAIMDRLGHWKRKPINQLSLLTDKTRGTLAGEGASFFVVSDANNGNAYAKLASVETFFNPENDAEIETRIGDFLNRAGTEMKEIGLVILGVNGDPTGDRIYNKLMEGLFRGSAAAYYKHLCGEYMTAGAFSLWLACKILRTKTVPEVIRLNAHAPAPGNILLYNHYRMADHSLMLIKPA
jgi:3-oxoacyl-[acyl-carrier-protein] synthase II